MDLTNQDFLKEFSTMADQSFELIYVEGWSFHTADFFQMIHQVLRDDGHFLMTLGKQISPAYRQELYECVGGVGFSPTGILFMNFPLLTQIHQAGGLGKRLTFPVPSTASLLNPLLEVPMAEKLVRNLIDQTPPEDRQLVLWYKIALVGGRLQKELDQLDSLVQLGFDPSFDHDRVGYVLIRGTHSPSDYLS
jgi:hypothetical protein